MYIERPIPEKLRIIVAMTTNSVFPPTRPVVQNPSKSLEICTKVRSQHCLSAMFPFSFHYVYCHIFDISMVSNKSDDILLVFIQARRAHFAGPNYQAYGTDLKKLERLTENATLHVAMRKRSWKK